MNVTTDFKRETQFPRVSKHRVKIEGEVVLESVSFQQVDGVHRFVRGLSVEAQQEILASVRAVRYG